MPTEFSSFSERPDPAIEADMPTCDSDGNIVPEIRKQAAEIIEAVLSGSEPQQELARTQLRRCLAAHPGRPEAALLDHLIAMRAPGKPPAGTSNPQSRYKGSFQQPATMNPDLLAEAGRRLSRIESVLQGRMILTAFQPICDLSHGGVVAAEALTRFFTEGSDEAADWFAEAKVERLGSDLEFAALESGLEAAQDLPPHLTVAIKLSAASCLDPLLQGILEDSALAPGRLVLELTEAMTREQPGALSRALAPLRRSGVRLAIDHAGSHFTSIRHIRQLGPDIIKLDRDLVQGIDKDPLRSSLAEAMVGLADDVGAIVIAQGVETFAELAAARALGAAAAQGYLLGRPTTSPEDWSRWIPVSAEHQSMTLPESSSRPDLPATEGKT